ncbi:MAG: AraC family transcriptional regulator [Myxococcales bacterium]|nr:AraC family transcriptional regulator [Myxococcales bacterium]
MDALSGVLRAVRLTGAVFFQADFTAPWALESPESSMLAQALLPDARQVVLFHLVRGGRCWVDVPGQPRIELGPGDVIVFPLGDRHVMGSGAAEAVTPVTALFPGPPPFVRPPRLAYGGGGAATGLVCGYLYLERVFFSPLFGTLPRVLVARPDDGAAGAMLRSSAGILAAALEGCETTSDATPLDPSAPGGAEVLARLTELLFVEVLRRHMAKLAPEEVGFFAAIRDPGVGRALEAFHREPCRPWTVEQLARQAAMSRSGFAARFVELLGESPAQYTLRWRLRLAAQRLRETTDSIAEVATESGYASEAAFSRAFKREHGLAPGRFRSGPP